MLPDWQPSKLAEAIGAALGMGYLEPWLLATILNPAALPEYWHRDRNLRIEEMVCTTFVSELDAELSIVFRGRNEATSPVTSCPMLMFGGSVLHWTNIPGNETTVRRTSEAPVLMSCRSLIDTGQFQLIDMIFPVPLRPGEEFEIEQKHLWPTGMAAGEDTLWYPYPALFSRNTGSVVARVHFDRAVRYILALEGRPVDAECQVGMLQPTDLDGTARSFEWRIDPVDNTLIYGLAFDR
ncbi:hypothetical protein [Actinomadura monticuli]|uniref:Uncharacterized protein n=1 Tax=Actinomadura monticuli TaxID=3097367 RepID=A0ABV4QGA1_9ACTN